MNKSLKNPELMDTFLVGNHCHIFRKVIKSNVVNISKSINEYYQKIILKTGHEMDLYPALHCLIFSLDALNVKRLSAEGDEKWVIAVDTQGNIYCRTGYS